MAGPKPCPGLMSRSETVIMTWSEAASVMPVAVQPMTVSPELGCAGRAVSRISGLPPALQT